ncbi:MAG: glycosyltransferase [Conexivisphaera sp.]
MGLLRTPVEPSIYPLVDEKEGRALIYLGGADDTDIGALLAALRILEEERPGIELDAFGDERTARIVGQRVRVNYLGKLERSELSVEYGRHAITIAPIYNGNFEMVPVQSLLCGTPVITFPQPFMEVTGDSPMVANIENPPEVRTKVRTWLRNEAMTPLRREIRARILREMDNEVVAGKLLRDYASQGSS